MKALSLLLLTAGASALPGKTSSKVERRQTAEACSVGYCLENGGTTGGADAEPVVVTDLAQLKAAASASGPAVIVVSGTISAAADKVSIKSDKTIFGEAGSVIDGISLEIKGATNVILRNLKIQHVLYEAGDAISLNAAKNVWIDHVDLSGDLTADKNSYDGLLDITHGSDWVTVSNSYFHEHYKAALIGHADSNGAEDEGSLHVTFANNYWQQVDSRVPSVRFGTIHVVNSYFDQVLSTGINARQKSQVFVQSSAFADSTAIAIYSDGSDYQGYAVLDDVDLGGSANSAGPGTLTPESFPYPPIETLGSAAVAEAIPGSVGQIL